MTSYAEPARALEFLLSEASGTRSRENVTLAASQGDLPAGTVLGTITKAGTASAQAFSGNTGTGTVGTITGSAGAKPGAYKLVIIEPATDAGKFSVEDPDGIIIGTGAVAAAFSAGGLAFTVSDGTDFVAGDGFTITVAAGSGYYVIYDEDEDNGAEEAVGILGYPAEDDSSTQAVTIFARDCEVKEDYLNWGDADSDGITAGTAQLAALGIIIRAA